MMKKTLMLHAGAMASAGLMVMALLVATAPEAESRSGVGNDRTGDTVSNQGMMVSSTQISVTAPNDDIKPMSQGKTITNNHYETTGAKVQKGIKHGE